VDYCISPVKIAKLSTTKQKQKTKQTKKLELENFKIYLTIVEKYRYPLLTEGEDVSPMIIPSIIC
jgi:hypothetical protein